MIVRTTLVLAALAVLSAGCECGTVSGDARRDGAPPGVDGSGSACGASRTRVTGTTYAPNGTDPIPNVLVYVVPEGTALPAPATGVQCQICGATPPFAVAATHSGLDGAFSLSSPALDEGGTFDVVVESGGFRHVERRMRVGPCSTIALEGARTSLPGASSGDDTIPRIAVASSTRGTGDVNDQFVHVLDLMGITGYERVDPSKSGAPFGSSDLYALLATPSFIDQYQIVIAPCGSMGNFSVEEHLTPEMIANVRRWLAAGGRLYVSDLAYAILEQSFPEAMTFATGPSPRAGTDDAVVGVGIGSSATLMADVDDPALLSWLELVGAVPRGETRIPIGDLRDPWAAIDAVDPVRLMPDATGVRRSIVWVSADVDWHVPGSGHHPLTVQSDFPNGGGDYCGRAVFTSYHVQTGSGSELLPQERVLEYLFFQLSGCIPSLI